MKILKCKKNHHYQANRLKTQNLGKLCAIVHILPTPVLLFMSQTYEQCHFQGTQQLFEVTAHVLKFTIKGQFEVCGMRHILYVHGSIYTKQLCIIAWMTQNESNLLWKLNILK